MAWVAVSKQGREFISMCKPIRVVDEDNYDGWKDVFFEVSLPNGSIKKLIGLLFRYIQATERGTS